jgi:hypothetical protein
MLKRWADPAKSRKMRRALKRRVWRFPSPEERFWLKVDKSSGHGPWGDCWLWTAAKDKKGYGRFYGFPGERRQAQAHRVSWRLAHGDIPEGISVLHSCDVPACENPAHLFLGTNDDNLEDMRRKGRMYCKLSDADVDGIRGQFAAGTSARTLARQFNVAREYIYYIVKMKCRTVPRKEKLRG